MVKVDKDTAFKLIYDFLKRNRIVREFVIEAFDYHKQFHRLGNVSEPFGRDNAKNILLFLIDHWHVSAGSNLFSMFLSFDGSFEWATSKRGPHYWRQYLEYKWQDYLRNRYKDYFIQII